MSNVFKKINVFAFVFILLLSSSTISMAQTKKPSPSPTGTAEPSDAQIEKIKDLVASKVAELKLVEKRGIIGKVKSASNTQIVLINDKNKEVEIDIDELTKFDDEDDDDFGISDIKDGDEISVIGLYNKDTKHLLARFISIVSNIPENVSGVVTGKDAKNFTLTVTMLDGKEKTVDIETSTKTSGFENGKIAKTGFSKIEPGARVVVIGFQDLSEENLINASRILYLSEISAPASIDLGEENDPTPTEAEEE